MKYEKEAMTRNGRRTRKVTYELVRGPEPKTRRKSEKTVTSAAPPAALKREAKKLLLATKKPKKPADKKKHQKDRVPKDKGQLRFF